VFLSLLWLTNGNECDGGARAGMEEWVREGRRAGGRLSVQSRTHLFSICTLLSRTIGPYSLC